MSGRARHTAKALTAFLALLAAMALGTAAAAASDPEPVAPNPDTPVVLIVLDELPTATLLDADQRIDANRFPRLAGFAAHATWYRDHVSAGDYTAWAVPPILTGNHSDDETLPTNEVQPNNIFNLLGPGRRVHAMEEVTELCSKKYCPDGHQGEAPDQIYSSEFIKAKFKLVKMPEVRAWIDGIPAGSRALSMIHLPLPHQPQRFLPNGMTYPGGPLGFTIPPINGWTISNSGISLVQQRHILQTAYTDSVVGKMIDKIKRNGDWDRSMVIVTADHGYSFDSRYDRRDVGPHNIAATVNPPLIIKYPHQREGHLSTRSTQAIDILPTIARQLGEKIPWKTEGRPIDEVPDERQMVVDKDLMAEMTVSTAQVRSQRPKLIETSIRRFGSGGLWRLGPHADLIGRRPGRSRPLRNASVTIDSPERYREYRPSQEVPSLISAEVTGLAPSQVVAVSVNGRITGTTRTFKYEGAMRFGSMAPSSAFHRGRNRIKVFAVKGPGTLRRIR